MTAEKRTPGCRVTVECGGSIGTSYDPDAGNLLEVVELFEQAVHACGFRFSGHLEFVEAEI